MLSALLVGTRYEGLFVVGAGLLLLIRRSQWRSATALACGAALAIFLYGFFAVLRGYPFLPASVLLKGLNPNGYDPLASIVVNIVFGAHLALLAAAGFLAAGLLRRSSPDAALLLVIAAFASVLQLFAARVGYAFRYESYLVGALIVLLSIPLSRLADMSFRGRVGLCVLMFPAVFLLGMRAAEAATKLPGYARAIYLQQWQTAHLLAAYFPSSSVAANDIGAISYFTDIHCTDLVGLANDEVFQAKREHRFTTEVLRRVATTGSVEFVVVYDDWFTGHPQSFNEGPRLPAEWIRVGKLTTLPADILGGTTVSFYGVDAARATALRQALVQFAPKLPQADRLRLEP